MCAPGPTGERQEHLDAIVPFAGSGQKRRLCRESHKRATGDLPEECRSLLNTRLMFLKEDKDPTSKQFDDDDWIRSLTEAQEVTTDITEDRITYEQQEVDSKKSRPIQVVEFLLKGVSRWLLALSEGEIAPLTTSMRQIGVGTPGGAEALASFIRCRARRRRSPVECSLALGMVAAETPVRIPAKQAASSLPWIGVDDPSEQQRLQAARMQ